MRHCRRRMASGEKFGLQFGCLPPASPSVTNYVFGGVSCELWFLHGQANTEHNHTDRGVALIITQRRRIVRLFVCSVRLVVFNEHIARQ